MNIIILNENKIKKISFHGVTESSSFWFDGDQIMTHNFSPSMNYFPGHNSPPPKLSKSVPKEHLEIENCFIKDGKIYENPKIVFIYDDGDFETKRFPDMIEAESFLSELEKSLKFNIIKYKN